MPFLGKILQKGIVVLLSVVIVGMVSLSCSSVPVPDCTEADAPPVLIRWGVIQSKEVTGVELTPDAEIRTFRQNIPSLQRIYNDGNKETTVLVYCNMKKKIAETFLKVQTLNAPGKLSHFVEYDNGSGTVLRAIWNPEFATKGSAEFREIYQELQTIAEQ
jgi:hypothetical protein